MSLACNARAKTVVVLVLPAIAGRGTQEGQQAGQPIPKRGHAISEDTMKHHTRISTIALIALAGLVASSTSALAQEGRGPRADRPREQPQEGRPQERGDRQERPMLSGPRVRDERMPGVESGFSAGGGEAGRGANQPVPPQVFREAMATLMAEDAPLEIRLSPEQRERIGEHLKAFEARMREARGQNGRGARPEGGRRGPQTDARPGGQDRQRGERQERPERPERGAGRQAQGDRPQAQGDRPTRGDQPGMRPERAERQADQRGGAGMDRGAIAKELAGVQQRVWAELSAAQQAHVGKAIEAWRQEADQQRMGQMQERYRREFGERFEQMEGQQGRRPETDRRATDRQGGDHKELRRWFSELPEDVQRQVHDRLGAMPQERRDAVVARAMEMAPEQREQLVRRLLQSERPGGQNPQR